MGRVKAHKPRRARTFNPRVVIPDFRMYSWASQAVQYPQVGDSGIVYRREHTEVAKYPVDCLLYYSPAGQLVGVLNHYPQDIPPFESAGNVNLWVHPDAQRGGVGTALIAEADKRWSIDFNAQQFTASGAALVRRYLEGSRR